MTLTQFTTDLVTLLPFIFLIVWASLLLLVELILPAIRRGASMAALAAIGLLTTLALAVLQQGQTLMAFDNTVSVDGYAIFLNALFSASGLFGVALSYDYMRRMNIERGEFYPLMLYSIAGMMLMGSAADLMVVFIALELLSIPLYVLSGFARPKPESEEAAMKYFLLGAFASGFVVYGITLIFGAAGSTNFALIAKAVTTNALMNSTLFSIGASLLLIGLGFKIASVPFHMWTPDVYHGAPTAVTAFMAAGAKAGGFAALLRLFIVIFPSLQADFAPIIWVLSALTMLVGNVLAIAQTNIKRMLAYSSIAHAGYLLMPLIAFGIPVVAPSAAAAVLFYLVAYSLTNFGVWAVVIVLEKSENRGLNLEDYAGLGRKYPWLAAAMVVFMLSFAGVPPTLGFVGKFYLFRTVLDAGYVNLALVGVLTSLISAYYYLRIVVIMFMHDGDPQITHDWWVNLTAGVSAVALVLLTFAAGPLFGWAAQALIRVF